MNADLWKRQAALFLTSQGSSLLGSMVVQYALMWHLTITTQSGEVMTLAIIVGFVPMLLISPFAGAWADRLPKRFLIAASDALAALSTVALFVALLFGHDHLWVILAAMGLRAVGQAVQSPAVSAILPEIVPEDQLMRINGYNGSLQSGIGLVSPLLAGALLSIMPMQWVLLIDIVTAAFAIFVMLFLVKVAHVPSDAAPVGALREIRDGFVYVWRHRFVRRLFWYFAVTFFLAAPVSFLTPLQVTRSYSNDVWRLTAIEMAFFIGMTAGGILIGQWGGFKRKAATIAFAIAGMGVFTVALGIPQPFVLFNLWMLLIGVLMPAMNAPTMTLLQTKVEPRFLGRVMSVMMMISTSTMPLGMLFFGPMADRVQIEFTLIVTGALMVIGGALVLVDRTIRDGEEAPVAATE
ncbi:MAG: MFS transporter [Propionibacteriaceae bacterium]|nr:MFS transporter [Propionibacteriaceae bacterium]